MILKKLSEIQENTDKQMKLGGKCRMWMRNSAERNFEKNQINLGNEELSNSNKNSIRSLYRLYEVEDRISELEPWSFKISHSCTCREKD